MTVASKRQLKIMLIAGEESGDQLGYKLMRALRASCAGDMAFSGIGGFAMVAEGLETLFALSDIAVMGFAPVVRRLPTLLRRINETAQACIAARPDALVLIDAPDFTHRVARKVRRALPDLPIVDYVSPTVWAWRPGRARKMRGYVSEVLALLPFEPAAHLRLGGPPCTYVGHPLVERLAELRPSAADQAARLAEPPVLLILPGSRRSEIERLMPVFGHVLRAIVATYGPVEAILPAVDRHVGRIEALVADWPVRPRIVLGEAAKFASFRRARAALAASGTVSLELALAQVPMVIAYKVAKWEALIARQLVQVATIVLPNLILGEHVVPEFIQAACNPQNLAGALLPLLQLSGTRDAQLAGFARLAALMVPDADLAPSDVAASRVMHWINQSRQAGPGNSGQAA